MVTERFTRGQKVIVEGSNGIPDRLAIVQSHVATSVFVEFEDKRWGTGWHWEAHVHPVPAEILLDAEGTHVPSNLFDFEEAEEHDA